MNVLVFGAGPLGSLFAMKLQEGGHEVTLLARGQRLADLRAHGIVLVNTQTGQQSVARFRIEKNPKRAGFLDNGRHGPG